MNLQALLDQVTPSTENSPRDASLGPYASLCAKILHEMDAAAIKWLLESSDERLSLEQGELKEKGLRVLLRSHQRIDSAEKWKNFENCFDLLAPHTNFKDSDSPFMDILRWVILEKHPKEVLKKIVPWNDLKDHQPGLRTPMELCAVLGLKESLKVLMDHVAFETLNPNDQQLFFKDNPLFTLLSGGASFEEVEIILPLLLPFFDINALHQGQGVYDPLDGATLLHYLIDQRLAEQHMAYIERVCEKLLAEGCVHIHTKFKGETPLEYVKHVGADRGVDVTRIVTLLMAHEEQEVLNQHIQPSVHQGARRGKSL